MLTMQDSLMEHCQETEANDNCIYFYKRHSLEPRRVTIGVDHEAGYKQKLKACCNFVKNKCRRTEPEPEGI